MKDVGLVLAVAFEAGGRRHATAVKTFGIDGIDAEEANVAAIDGVAERIDQSPVLVIVEASLAGGEDEDLRARVSEDEEFHVAAEAMAEPFMVLAVHSPSE